MRLDWNEVRARAASFSERFKDARYENGDTHTFYNEFFACFGVDRKQVAVYEQRVRNLPEDKRGRIDLFMPGKLIVEQKSAGLDLRVANDQALNYYEALPEALRPRYILTCNFQQWHLLDLHSGGDGLRFQLADLKKHITAFAFIAGIEVRQFKNQKIANPKATELLSKLHRQLEADGYAGHKLQLLLVRLLFVLFADDTGIWRKDQFLTLLEQRTSADGRDLGRWLTELFEVLNTAPVKRQAGLDADLAAFPHINGKLFEEPIGTAVFDNATRLVLIDACLFDWGSVSPAIFGALFEGVIDKVTRRKQGAHYTPEEAIFRLIGPLFLEGLHDEFERLRARKDGRRDEALRSFHDKLASLTFFDPACGAGNFLVVAYRELRELERSVIEEVYPPGTALPLDVSFITKINVDQFYGIEIDEFPSQIAQVALWMADHIANVNLGDVYGKSFARIPLVTAPNIRHADALETDWASVLPPERCSYVFGNPPFVGAKMQSEAQRAQVRRIAKLGGSGGTLDFVAAWFLKAGDYIQGGDARIAFIATNSITQGEQVAQLWPKLFERGLEIAFGHRTFVWPGRAAVHCVIVGLDSRGNEPTEKRLFSYPDQKAQPVETKHDWLTAYLFASRVADRHLVVKSAGQPVNGAPRLRIGSKPVDGGYLIVTPEEKARLSTSDKGVQPFLREFIGAKEFLNGGHRYILWLKGQEAKASKISFVQDRLRRVRKWRDGEIASKDSKTGLDRASPSTKPLAANPSSYHVTVVPEGPFLVIPENGSDNREYVPAGWLQNGEIPSSLIRVSEHADLYHFGVIVSRMHMAWLNGIGGKLKSDPRYSIELVYNTFPWADVKASDKEKVRGLASCVLAERKLEAGSMATLSNRYNPDFMPPELRKAHRDLDLAVDKLYVPKGFADDRARVEHLFRLYERLVMPSADALRQNRRVARARRVATP